MRFSVNGSPMAAMTIIDADTAWFKATIGFESGPVDRVGLPCNTAVQQTQPLVVADTQPLWWW